MSLHPRASCHVSPGSRQWTATRGHQMSQGKKNAKRLLVASLLLLAMPFVTSSFLFQVVRPEATSSVLATSCGAGFLVAMPGATSSFLFLEVVGTFCFCDEKSHGKHHSGKSKTLLGVCQ